MALNDLLLGTEAVCEVKVHPLVLFQILDRALRRPEDQERVIGTLLGRVENGVAEITNSFAVPHLENGDEVAVGKDFHTQMYELHQRVNDAEVIVGWYATTTSSSSVHAVLDEHSCLIHDFYGSVCEMPVHVVVDTSLVTDQLQVSAFVSSPLEVVDAAHVNQFKQILVTQRVSEPEAVALDAMLQSPTHQHQDEEDTQDNESTPKQSTALALTTELASLEQSIEKLHACLEHASHYVKQVLANKVPRDTKLGRELADALASIPSMRQEQFDQVFNHGLQDLLMVSYLSGLTQAQLSMAEKLINS